MFWRRPALALSGEHGWVFASGLIIVERIGKAIKKPAKSTLMSFGGDAGRRWQELWLFRRWSINSARLRLMLYLVLLVQNRRNLVQRYAFAPALLIIPAIATIVMLFVTKRKFPNPEQFEPNPSSSFRSAQ